MAQAKHCSITRRGILSALAVLPATSPRDPGFCYAVSSVGRNKRRAATRAERIAPRDGGAVRFAPAFAGACLLRPTSYAASAGRTRLAISRP